MYLVSHEETEESAPELESGILGKYEVDLLCVAKNLRHVQYFYSISASEKWLVDEN